VTPTTNRPYAGEDNYARMRALLTAISALGGSAVYCTVGDLDWWRYNDEPEAIALAQLWFTGDLLVGVAWPKDDQVDLLTHPHHRDIEAGMMSWAERARRARADAGGEALPLRTWTYDGDAPRTALLQAHGYTRTATHFRYHSRLLDTPVPVSPLPPEYTLRPVTGTADIEPRVAVHRAAFAPSRMSAARYHRLMGAPTYRADLDLIVVAPDGTFAAFCIVWFDVANRLGVFEPVGTHPAHRRRGLGQAILYEGLRRLRQLGARTAFVNSYGGDEAAERLYTSVGFQLVDRNYAWEKLL